jgi:anti-sigma regulatory factor (Ser/Thr protein kinase)
MMGSAWFAVLGRQADTLSTSSWDAYLRWSRVSVLELGPVPAAPSRARLHVRTVLAEWGVPHFLVGDAEMLCAELTANALRASLALMPPQPIGLRLLANEQRLVIEVWDAHPDDPVRRDATATAESGRGLAIVEELSNRWGSRRLGEHVKTVWAELLLPSARGAAIY